MNQSLNPGHLLPDTRWLIPNVLPVRQLILLDGSPGVGKTCLTAAVIASLCRAGLQPDDSILYLTTRNQFPLTSTFLRRHEPDYSRLHHTEYQHDELENPCYLHFTEHVRTLLEQHKPALFVIDSLEELFAECNRNHRDCWRHIFTQLRAYASIYDCTIIVPRCQGNHESRPYGHMAREGSSIARFILTLHYHPIDPLARILTLAKNQTGPIGSQSLIRFQVSGQIQLIPLEPHEHVKPARAPATWRPADPHEDETQEILKVVESFMQGQITAKKDVKDHVLSQGYSERAYNRFLGKVKMRSTRNGTPNWHFFPTIEMFYRSPPGLKAMEQLTQSPRATPAAGDQTPVKPADLTPLRQAG